MRKLRKLKLTQNVEMLNEAELKMIIGGGQYGSGWKCTCHNQNKTGHISGDYSDASKWLSNNCNKGGGSCTAKPY